MELIEVAEQRNSDQYPPEGSPKSDEPMPSVERSAPGIAEATLEGDEPMPSVERSAPGIAEVEPAVGPGLSAPGAAAQEAALKEEQAAPGESASTSAEARFAPGEGETQAIWGPKVEEGGPLQPLVDAAQALGEVALAEPEAIALKVDPDTLTAEIGKMSLEDEDPDWSGDEAEIPVATALPGEAASSSTKQEEGRGTKKELELDETEEPPRRRKVVLATGQLSLLRALAAANASNWSGVQRALREAHGSGEEKSELVENLTSLAQAFSKNRDACAQAATSRAAALAELEGAEAAYFAALPPALAELERKNPVRPSMDKSLGWINHARFRQDKEAAGVWVARRKEKSRLRAAAHRAAQQSAEGVGAGAQDPVRDQADAASHLNFQMNEAARDNLRRFQAELRAGEPDAPMRAAVAQKRKPESERRRRIKWARFCEKQGKTRKYDPTESEQNHPYAHSGSPRLRKAMPWPASGPAGAPRRTGWSTGGFLALWGMVTTYSIQPANALPRPTSLPLGIKAPWPASGPGMARGGIGLGLGMMLGWKLDRGRQNRARKSRAYRPRLGCSPFELRATRLPTPGNTPGSLVASPSSLRSYYRGATDQLKKPGDLATLRDHRCWEFLLLLRCSSPGRVRRGALRARQPPPRGPEREFPRRNEAEILRRRAGTRGGPRAPLGARKTAVSPSTQRLYDGHWRWWELYTRRRGVSALRSVDRFDPGEESLFLDYLVYLFVGQGLAAATAQARLGAIRSVHLQLGFPDPLKPLPRLQLALEGIRRRKGPIAKRRPVTPHMLARAQAALPQGLWGRRLNCALQLGFFFLLRVSELVGGNNPKLGLRFKDVKLYSRGEFLARPPFSGADEVQIVVRASKTDPEGESATRNLFRSDAAVRPVLATIEFLELKWSEATPHPEERFFGDLTRQDIQTALQTASANTAACMARADMTPVKGGEGCTNVQKTKDFVLRAQKEF
ncbi:L96 [Symbiodinium sp. CCMP2592]|nr:L96 [Symbiodinium sp. CCMP2592]